MGRIVDRKRVVAIASGGGHWLQLRRLAPVFEGMDVAYVSVLDEYAADVGDMPFHTVTNVTRLSIGRLLALAPQIFRILMKERPHAVVTTGSAPGLVGIAIAKLCFGSRTVWIDSMANYERLSTSGRVARWFADVWLTQWPHLAGARERPAFWGSVL